MQKRQTLAGVCVLAVSMVWVLQSCGPKTQTVKTSYPDGKLWEEFEAYTLQEDGAKLQVKHGRYKRYYPNGKVQTEAEFKQGLVWAVAFVNDPEGKPLAEKPVSKGNGNWVFPDTLGHPMITLVYENGELAGIPQLVSAYSNPTALFGGGLPRHTLQGAAVELASQGGSAVFSDSLAPATATAGSTATASGYNPAQTDALVERFKNRQFKELYAQTAAAYRKEINETGFSTYLNYLLNLYGPVSTWKRAGYNLENVSGGGEGVTALYEVGFKHVRGQLLVQLIREGQDYKLVNMAVQCEDFAPIFELKKISEPIVRQLQNEQYDDIYRNASTLFKQVVPKNKYDEMVGQLRTAGKLEKYELAQHQVSFGQGRLMVAIIYKVTIGGKEAAAQLTMSQYGKEFLLDGFNFQ
jgi:hypothetical protein